MFSSSENDSQSFNSAAGNHEGLGIGIDARCAIFPVSSFRSPLEAAFGFGSMDLSAYLSGAAARRWSTFSQSTRRPFKWNSSTRAELPPGSSFSGLDR